MRSAKNCKPSGLWNLLTWLLVLAVLLIVLMGEAAHPTPATPTARERAAQVAAQERYYEVLNLYGDQEGAVEAAKLTYQNIKEEK